MDCDTCKYADNDCETPPCSDCMTPANVHWEPRDDEESPFDYESVRCHECVHRLVDVTDPPCDDCWGDAEFSKFEAEDPELEDMLSDAVAIVLDDGEEEDEEDEEPGMVGQYTARGGIEPIDFIVSNDMNFLEGNVIKYVYRYPFKGGLEALFKARTYLDWLIEEEEKKSNG